MKIGDQVIADGYTIPGKVAFYYTNQGNSIQVNSIQVNSIQVLVEWENWDPCYGGMSTNYCAANFPEVARYLSPGKYYSWWNANDVHIAVPITIRAQSVGCSCDNCYEYNSYASPNLPNGKFLCYSCRSTNAWKYQE